MSLNRCQKRVPRQPLQTKTFPTEVISENLLLQENVRLRERIVVLEDVISNDDSFLPEPMSDDVEESMSDDDDVEESMSDDVENAYQTMSDDDDDDNDDSSYVSPREFKMMCNLIVNGKRQSTNSKISKSLVEACFADGIHALGGIGANGEIWKCYDQAMVVNPGDIAHMYYGDVSKGNSKHYEGVVLTKYSEFGVSGEPFDDFPEVQKVWSSRGHKGSELGHRPIYCKVDWKEVSLTPEKETMIKHPGKNGFKVQGSILRIK